MDLESKISALKDFSVFGSSKKSVSPNSNGAKSNHNSGSSSANTQNGQWSSWFNKGAQDPLLPALVSESCAIEASSRQVLLIFSTEANSGAI